MELSLENILNEVDKIPGGLAKGKTLDDIAKKHNVDKNELEKQLEKGIKVESEHTKDDSIAKEIAMDHLFEDPKYYDKLSKIEEGTCGYNADVETGKEFKTPGGIKMRKDPYGLSAFAIELVKEFNNDVNEIGELSATPYKYIERSSDLELEENELFGTTVYDFSTGDIFYDVIFEYDYDSELNKNIVKVDFTANESYEMTGANEPYKIMSTILSIIKKELDKDIVKDNLDILLYMPAETKTKGGEAVRLRGINQRNELYKVFFKKNIPYVKMEETPNETRFYLRENQLNEAVRCKAIYNTPQNELVPYIKSLTQFMDENLELRPLPKVKFVDDEANASKVLGKTAYYDPQNCAITLYITDRHPKDILRSFAHEMIHHMQNMQGRLGNIGTQNINQDDNLKELEEEAYQLGNISLRSWENSQDQVNEIKTQPKNTGVTSALTTKEKEWIDNEFWGVNRDSYNHPSFENPDVPLDYVLADERSIKEDIDEGYRNFKDLEIFNSIHRKLGKNKVYTFNGKTDPKIKKYPEDYDLRDTVVGADYDEGIPVLYVLYSGFSSGDPYDTYGAFDKDTGEYLKYSDLDKIGKVDEIKAQPNKSGVGKLGQKLRVTFTLDPKRFPNDYNKNIKSIYDLNIPTEGILSSKGLPNVYGALFKSKSSENILLIIVPFDFNNNIDIKNNSDLKQWKQMLDDMNIPYNHSMSDSTNIIYGIPIEQYLYFNIDSSKLNTNEIKVQPKNTGIKNKLSLTFSPTEDNITTLSDFYTKLKNPQDFIQIEGVVSSKKLPQMFATIYLNKENKLIMDLETSFNHPKRYYIWVKTLSLSNIPFGDNYPFIDGIEIEKYVNLKINPI